MRWNLHLYSTDHKLLTIKNIIISIIIIHRIGPTITTILTIKVIVILIIARKIIILILITIIMMIIIKIIKDVSVEMEAVVVKPKLEAEKVDSVAKLVYVIILMLRPLRDFKEYPWKMVILSIIIMQEIQENYQYRGGLLFLVMI